MFMNKKLSEIYGSVCDGNHLIFIDVIRAISVLQIVLCHSYMSFVIKDAYGFLNSDFVDTSFWSYFLIITKTYCIELFFFVSGYLLFLESQRKSIKHIIYNKLFRFGIPIVLWQVPLLLFYHNLMPVTWYLEVLLSFIIVAMIVKYKFNSYVFEYKFSLKTIVAITIVMGVFSYLLRLRFHMFIPINLPFYHFEPSEIIKYIVMFYLGSLACRSRWFDEITIRDNKIIIILGVSLLLVGFILQRQIIKIVFSNYFFYTMFDCFQCMFIVLALVLLARIYLNRTNSFWNFIGNNTLGVYLFHEFVIFGVNLYIINKLNIESYQKMALSMILTLMISYPLVNLGNKVFDSICNKRYKGNQ